MLKKSTILLLFFFITNIAFAGGFLTTDGKKIVDGDGNEVLLKGLGLGGWLVPEGYMLQTSGFANSPSEIKQHITDLIGEDATADFYERYYANYVTREDINRLASYGFNSIRLPMHYDLLTPRNQPDVYIEEGFETIDSLLAWCADNEMYLILDLHCAPGGQSDENISDYDPAYPSLWESENNKVRTVNLWRELATRYVNETWIGGYDLLNEPKWDLPPNNQPLRELYIEITNAIREVDNNHIVFIEGNWYATDFGGLTPPWDSKMVYSFHKYWNTANQESIQYILDIRNEYNIPLWLGETGENSNAWFTQLIELMEQLNIGWAFWPHKKFDSTSGTFSAPVTPQYRQILDYWGGSGSQPGQTFSIAAMNSMADALKLENCVFHKDVIDAMFRQINSEEIIPFKDHEIPGRIYAVDYDMGKRNVAYRDNDYENVNGNGGAQWNQGWAYRNDGVDIEECTDDTTNGFNVGFIENGEWMKYSAVVKYPGTYKLVVRAASQNNGGTIRIAVNGSPLPSISVGTTGGWQNWSDYVVEDVVLPAGNIEILAQALIGDFNLNYFNFIPLNVSAVEDEEDETIPGEFKLNQNYPNPFNGSTLIKVYAPEETRTSLRVYNIEGRLIDVIAENELVKGDKTFTWSPSANTAVSSGVYFVQAKTKENSFYKKMLYLK